MAYVVMTCIVMAHIVIVCIVMAYIVMACMTMAYIAMAYVAMAYIAMTYIGMSVIGKPINAILNSPCVDVCADARVLNCAYMPSVGSVAWQVDI